MKTDIQRKPAMKTDIQLQQDVLAELQWEPSIDAAQTGVSDSQHITVSVVDGDVTLTGSVHSWSERDLARNSAWGSPGVRHVIDQMTVAY